MVIEITIMVNEITIMVIEITIQTDNQRSPLYMYSISLYMRFSGRWSVSLWYVSEV